MLESGQHLGIPGNDPPNNHGPSRPSGWSWRQQILDAQPTIEHWLRGQWLEHAAPFYASVDLRNSGFKLAPVDTNLFPGGFNNLNPEFLPLCVQAAMTALEKVCPEARGALLIPENHTRNMFYLQNVAVLQNILRRAGMKVRIGTLIPEITAPTEIALPDGGKLLLEPLVRKGNRIGVEGFDPCVVLLNNDLSAGIPEILENLEQPVIPPLYAGWSTRRKSHHFAAYQQVAEEFGNVIGIDPWLINPYFGACGEINFQERQGEDCLAGYVDMVLDAGPRQVRGVRDRPGAVRHREGRRRHLRHGHHEREETRPTCAISTASSATRWRWSRKACRSRRSWCRKASTPSRA